MYTSVFARFNQLSKWVFQA